MTNAPAIAVPTVAVPTVAALTAPGLTVATPAVGGAHGG